MTDMKEWEMAIMVRTGLEHLGRNDFLSYRIK
jgi:hypothetical protein